jgi:hypothetical protein
VLIPKGVNTTQTENKRNAKTPRPSDEIAVFFSGNQKVIIVEKSGVFISPTLGCFYIITLATSFDYNTAKDLAVFSQGSRRTPELLNRVTFYSMHPTMAQSLHVFGLATPCRSRDSEVRWTSGAVFFPPSAHL